MRHYPLPDSKIIEGFRNGNSKIIREYFYGYCQAGYNLFDQRYQLSEKENLDFLSLAHQYALYLMEHNWEPLENHSEDVSLKTWLIGGFRYIVLDALKWYRKEYGTITFEDYLQTFDLSNDLRLQFNRLVEDLCNNTSLARLDRLIIDLKLLKGFKGTEIAKQLGMSPSAVSQRYNRLKEEVIIPYFRKNFDMDLDMSEVMDAQPIALDAAICESHIALKDLPFRLSIKDKINKPRRKIIMNKENCTPAIITELQPNEIFVFGSNLKGMHGGGAAYTAYRKFGAIMGQGVGLQGQSYAIPTMQGGVETIKPYVDEFIQFAKDHPEKRFLVTRIGCGIAGFTDKEISPLFKQAHEVENIVLPPKW